MGGGTSSGPGPSGTHSQREAPEMESRVRRTFWAGRCKKRVRTANVQNDGIATVVDARWSQSVHRQRRQRRQR